MALHKEHGFRSFPSFPEPDNLDEDDDDDYDNNFIISLEDNGDEDESLFPSAPVGGSEQCVSYSSSQHEAVSSFMSMPYRNGSESMTKVSAFPFSPDACYRDTLTHSQPQLEDVGSYVLPGPQPLYSTSKGSLHCSYQHSLNGSLLSYPSHYPRSHFESGGSDEVVAAAPYSNKVNGTMAVPNFSVGSANSYNSMSGVMPAECVNSGRNHDHRSVPSSISQLQPTISSLGVPKMCLETIHLDKEAGGIWSEAVFLKTTEVLDSSFLDTDGVVQTNGSHLQTPNISTVPKLSGPYPKLCSPQIGTQYSADVIGDSAVVNVPERVLKTQVLNEDAVCSCVMCYKGKSGCENIRKSQIEEPQLTKEEKLLIFKTPQKRKYQRRDATSKSKKNKVSSQLANPGVAYMGMPGNSDITPNLVNCVSKADISALHTNSSVNMIDSQSTHLSSSSPGVAAQFIMVDVNKKYTSATNSRTEYKNLVTDILTGTDKPLLLPKTVTAAANVRSTITATPAPTMANAPLTFASAAATAKFSSTVAASSTAAFSTTATASATAEAAYAVKIPKLSSCATKVFLKSPIVGGQVAREVTSKSEFASGSTFSLLRNGLTSSGQTLVSPSVSLTSPPSSKVVYVSSDQVLVYPSTKPPVSIISLNQQPQSKALDTSHVAVLYLPAHNKSVTKQLSFDPAQQTGLISVPNHDHHEYSKRPENIDSVKTASLRWLMKKEETGDTQRRKVILKLKQRLNTPATEVGHTDISEVTLIDDGNKVYPVSSALPHMRSLLKDSLQTRGISIVPSPLSVPNLANSKPGYSASNMMSPPGMGASQPALRLVMPVVQDKTPEKSGGKLASLLRGDLKTSKVLVQNVAENSVPETFQRSLVLKPIDKLSHKSPPERDKPVPKEILNIQDKVPDELPSPHPPQEGLPSTYIEDWVNKAKTYVSEQLKEFDDTDTFLPSFPECHSKALGQAMSQETPPTRAPVYSANEESRNNLETPDGMGAILPILETPSQLQLKAPACTSALKTSTLLSSQLDLPQVPVSVNSSASITGDGYVVLKKQLETPPVVHKAGEESSITSSLTRKLMETSATAQRLSHSESGQVGLELGDAMRVKSRMQDTYPAAHASSPSSSSIVDNSKGIKLKIKLGDFRNERMKHKHSKVATDSSVKSSENATVSHSRDEFNLNKSASTGAQVSGCDTEKQDTSDRAETAEEMFQRFQKQAVQEVVKAQMGMGYVSRSLRPPRTTMAFLDKYSFHFEPGRPKKKHFEERVSAVSEKSVDSNSHDAFETVHDVDKSNNNKQHKKLAPRCKRQGEEAGDAEVKMKQSKLTLTDCPKLKQDNVPTNSKTAYTDYPRLKQDNSITDSKTVYCTNILAGHKVYVKFNTFENVCSGRAFLVPFFNIGGTRTQFDVEDMEYINKAVMEFESEEISCARQLLFYSRSGNKAVFLRKETNLQASHIQDKNYKKANFILEGFRRNNKKPIESSPEHWKVDNTIDIEIDRAEVDNDVEIEFDQDMCFDEGVDELGIIAESAEGRKSSQVVNSSNYRELEMTNSVSRKAAVQSSRLASQDSHPDSVEAGACLNTIHVSELNAQDVAVNVIHAETVSVYDKQGAKFPIAAEFSNSHVHSDQTLMPSHEQQFNNALHENTTKSCENQMVILDVCTAVKEEVLDHNCDVPCPPEAIFHPAWIKKEVFDDHENESINQFDNSHLSCSITSVQSSPNPDRRPDYGFVEPSFIIKDEPRDDYFDALGGAESFSHGGYQIESVRNDSDASCEESLNDPTISALQDESAGQVITGKGITDKVVTCKDNTTSSSMEQRPHVEVTTVQSQLQGSHNCQDPMTEHSIISSCAPVTKLQFSDECDKALNTQTRDSEVIRSALPLKISERSSSEHDREDESSSSVLSSRTGLSLPESPLPSSSMSVSSEILVSSDVDDTENLSEEEDEGRGDNQSAVHNKINSLVELLRHRLTQDTSNLPPWVDSNISKSDKKMKAKKRKRLKKKGKNELLEHSIPPDPEENICSSSATKTCSPTQIVSAVSSPAISSVFFSAHQETAAMPLSSHGSTCTPSLPLDHSDCIVISKGSPENISAVNPKQSFSCEEAFMPDKVVDPSVDKCTGVLNVCGVRSISSECVAGDQDEDMDSETKDVIDVDDDDDDSFERKLAAKVQVCSYLPGEVCVSGGGDGRKLSDRRKSSDDHLGTTLDAGHMTCPGPTNPHRQSPVDFEIEIGNEDLPETALNLQLILPGDDLDLEALQVSRSKFSRPSDRDASLLSSPDMDTGYRKSHWGCEQLQHVNRAGEETLALTRLQKSPRKHSWVNSPLVNTVSHVEKLQVSDVSETPGDSVTSYLCQRFRGENHNIKGPRLLHPPSSRRSSTNATSKQTAPAQNLLSVSTPSEPITTEELLKTPTLDEIFGTSVDKCPVAHLENKIDSVANSGDDIMVSSNSSSQQKVKCQRTPTAQVSSKKKQNRRKRKNGRLSPRIYTHSETAEGISGNCNISLNTTSSLETQESESSNKIGTGLEVLPSLSACKIVLTKLEQLKLSNIDRLSDGVFLIRTDNTLPVKSGMGKTKTDDSGIMHQEDKSVKSTFKKAARRKGKKMARPGFRRKRDVVDYYAYMLESLQKKAQQLEEETKRREEEKKREAEKGKCEKVEPLQQSANVSEKGAAAVSCEELKDQAVITNTEENQIDNSQEVSDVTLITDCLSQPSIDIEKMALPNEAPNNTQPTDDAYEPTHLSSCVECAAGESSEGRGKVKSVCLTDVADDSPKIEQEAGVRTVEGDSSDSNWPYLQKFCDETIFDQGNMDYIQKVNKDICFTNMTDVSSCELNFEKKDVVLSSSVNTEQRNGDMNACVVLNNSEDSSVCIDEHERDNVDEDDILLDLKSQKSSNFNCDDPDTRHLPFTHSPTAVHETSPNIGESNSTCGDEKASCAVPANDNSLSPVPFQEASEDTISDVTGVSNSYAAADQSQTKMNVVTRYERSQKPADVSPSWERLLGHSCIDTSNQLPNVPTSSQPIATQNHDVSFVASSSFKLKFKLPKGVISKALQLSRDMKQVFEEAAKDNTLPSSSEETAHHETPEAVCRNNTNQYECRELPGNGDRSGGDTLGDRSGGDISGDISGGETLKPSENLRKHLMPQVLISKLKLSSETLNVINKARAELLQKRHDENGSTSGSTAEHRSEIVESMTDEEENGGKEVWGLGKLKTADTGTSLLHRGSFDDVSNKSKSCNSESDTSILQQRSPNIVSQLQTSDKENSNLSVLHHRNYDGECKLKTSDSENSTSVLLDGEKADIASKLETGDTENGMSLQHRGSSDDCCKKLLPNSLSCSRHLEVKSQCDPCPGSYTCDLSSSEAAVPVSEKQPPSNRTGITQTVTEDVVQTEDTAVSETVSCVSNLSTDEVLSSVSLRQNRKHGIFSNLDLFQECEADAPNQRSEPSSSKELPVGNVDKKHVIDIRKLKLKLNPFLSGKLKENTQKGVTTSQASSGISHAWMEKIARTSFHKLQQKLNPRNLVKIEANVNVDTLQQRVDTTFVASQQREDSVSVVSQQTEESTSVAKSGALPHSGLASVELLDSQAKGSEDGPLDFVLLNNHASDQLNAHIPELQQTDKQKTSTSVPQPTDKLDTNLPESQPTDKLNTNLPESQPTDKLNTNLPVPQLTDKLDTNLPESQPTDKLDINLPESQPTDELNTSTAPLLAMTPISELSERASVPTQRQLSHVNTAKLCSILKNFHKTGSTPKSASSDLDGVEVKDSKVAEIVNGDGSDTHRLTVGTPDPLGSDVANVVVGEAKPRNRGRKRKCTDVQEKHEVLPSREVRRTTRQSALTNSVVEDVTHTEQLKETHDESVSSNEQLVGEEKGGRSFFDCLPSVPLNAWEDT